jgi:hypothetical protein
MPPSIAAKLWLMYLLGWFDQGSPIGHGVFQGCDDCGRVDPH